jgi:hypothetical protein
VPVHEHTQNTPSQESETGAHGQFDDILGLEIRPRRGDYDA